MIKKMFMLFLLSIISFYQCNVLKIKENPVSLLLPPANVIITDITPTSATISWTPQIGTGSMVVYKKVGETSSNSTYTTSTSMTISSLTQCTTYEVKVQYVQAGGGYSVPITFTTPMWYCIENSTATITPYLYASNVTLNATDLPQMTSNSTGTKAYANFRSDPTRKVKLVRGSSNNTISVTKAGPATQNPTTIGIWIDYNGDRAFDPSSERILYSSNSTDMNPTATFNVPLQAGQVDCKVAMRVISNTTPYFTNCGPTNEIQDYEVEFIDASSLAIEESAGKNKEISISPNPASDVLNISGISEAADYEIYNAAGQKINGGKVSDHHVNLNHLSKGVYFIQLKDKEKVTRLKFIKK
ncbi:T9SS type A sorting domain-containing protein [Chryseobacterium sp. WLY505]|uniref:T9SS type A sorting domain-containing protein n=1 Tax=Chryseobacterium sp. WLY505 TaxID=3068892 RepID=UPI00279674BB|nr:T9SS type A sorting domain-containing protein [Chryseobacterium sp. WLY505]MDQ1855040.1 T9SS type A sorting domain-containing protein [Chryseobacterium sp. WLY505]